VIPLPPPDATLNEELARVISVRELPDGRVLITDIKENRLVIGDFRKNVASTIGRAGKGPGEYTSVGRLWPIGGDTTFMSEPYQSRWHTVVGDRIVKTQSDVPALRALPTPINLGVNLRREVFGRAFPRNAKGQLSRSDSSAVVRIAWTGAPHDTIGYLAPEKMDAGSAPVAAAGGGAPSGKRTFMISIKATDQLVVFPDGPFAIVRGDPYRVDWCTALKQCLNGPVLNGAEPAMSARDRDAYRIAFIRAARTIATEADLMEGWPATVPPFDTPGGPDDGSVWPTAGGKVAIERVPTAAWPTYTYDVVDRQGKRVASVSVPLGQFVIGFGVKRVYTVKVDETGVQRLQRHAWNY